MKSNFSWPSLLLSLCAGATLLFLLIPVAIVVPMSFSSAQSLTFPPPGFSLRWFSALIDDPAWIEAFSNSICIAALVATCSVLLGGLCSYGLNRGAPRWRTAAETNLMAPLIVPGVITAIAFYFLYSRLGLLGTYGGIVLAHTILAVPFVLIVLNTAISSFDLHLEQVAWSLGASWTQTLLRVVLPSLGPSIAAAWIFAFVISFDEIIVSAFVAGSIGTVPKKIYNDLMMEITPVITAVATVLIVATTLALLIAYKLTSRPRI